MIGPSLFPLLEPYFPVMCTAQAANAEEFFCPGFQILEKIGVGGMGEVYRACQQSLERIVAIKILRPPAAGTEHVGHWADVENESRLMASLNHPNIVTIHDIGQAGDRPYMVMEWVPGQSLRAKMRAGEPMPVPQTLAVIGPVADALTYIHSNGVLHLDLKPENVLCGEDGRVRITDFGLSIRRLDAYELSNLGFAAGTLDYCAPEQRHGLCADERCDIFSLAVIAYELLTGHVPGRAYVPASTRNPHLPKAVDSVFARALARDPELRQPSIQDFQRELCTALTRPTAVRWPVTWAALAMITVVVLGALLRSSGDRPAAINTQAVSSGPEAKGQSALPEKGPAPPDDISIDTQVGTQLDINKATLSQLMSLPGIGPLLAQRIVDERQISGPFRSPADLERVDGIGPSTVQAIGPLLRWSD